MNTPPPPAFGYRPGREPGDVPVITGSDPASFAHSVLHERNPALLAQVRDTNPYGPAAHDALDRLDAEITRGVLEPLRTDAVDGPAWAESAAEYAGGSWDDAPFLWVESFFYRKLLEAVGYLTPGPYYRLDPFSQLKAAELADPGLDEHFALLEKLDTLGEPARAEALLVASLWGNRADLGFHVGLQAAGGTLGAATGLLRDDSAAVLAHLSPESGHRLTLIADNAGRELLADLLLIDHLLTTGRAGSVSLHLKPVPYYVSDATVSDLALCLRRLGSGPSRVAQAASRLQRAIRDGRLEMVSHWFYTAPLSFHHMPDDLRDQLAAGSLTLIKGDLNYRRVTGDRAWEPTTPLADAVGYFPSPLALVRTLKCDVIVGLDADTARAAEAEDARWRVNGTNGVIQYEG